MLLDQLFPFHPPPKLSRESHVADGVIGSSSMQTARGPSSQALAISSQNANDNSLASKINAVSSNKGKSPKKLGERRNRRIPLLKNHLKTLLWQGNLLIIHV